MSCKISWGKFAWETFAIKSKTMGLEPGQLCYCSSFAPAPVGARGYRLWRKKTRFIALICFPQADTWSGSDRLYSKLCLAFFGWREDCWHIMLWVLAGGTINVKAKEKKETLGYWVFKAELPVVYKFTSSLRKRSWKGPHLVRFNRQLFTGWSWRCSKKI